MLEAKGKQIYTGDDSDWMILDVATNPGTSWNFDSFDFRLDGVVYVENSAQWKIEIRKAQLWAKLSR